jgi:hypothetical protein
MATNIGINGYGRIRREDPCGTPAAELGAKLDTAPQYWRAPPHEHKDLFNDLAFGAR